MISFSSISYNSNKAQVFSRQPLLRADFIVTFPQKIFTTTSILDYSDPYLPTCNWVEQKWQKFNSSSYCKRSVDIVQIWKVNGPLLSFLSVEISKNAWTNSFHCMVSTSNFGNASSQKNDKLPTSM